MFVHVYYTSNNHSLHIFCRLVSIGQVCFSGAGDDVHCRVCFRRGAPCRTRGVTVIVQLQRLCSF